MIVDQKINGGFAGVYLVDGVLNGVQLATTVKPNWLRRVAMRVFVGWKWISVKKLKIMTEAFKAAKLKADEELAIAAEELKAEFIAGEEIK